MMASAPCWQWPAVALLVGGLTFAVACAGAPAAAPAEGGGQTGHAVALRELAHGEQSNVEASKQAVARTAAQWATLWKEHEWERPAPPVDFSKEMAVAVFLGTQQSAGITVRVTEVTAKAGGGTVVRYRVTQPGPGGVAAQVLTFPYHIVAAPAHDGPYTFERVP